MKQLFATIALITATASFATTVTLFDQHDGVDEKGQATFSETVLSREKLGTSSKIIKEEYSNTFTHHRTLVLSIKGQNKDIYLQALTQDDARDTLELLKSGGVAELKLVEIFNNDWINSEIDRMDKGGRAVGRDTLVTLAKNQYPNVEGPLKLSDALQLFRQKLQARHSAKAANRMIASTRK